MGTYFSQILLPSNTTIVSQLWNIINFKILQKVTHTNSSNDVEILIDIPSSLCNAINDKIKNVMHTDDIIPIEQGVYDMYYLVSPEIDNLLPFDTITKLQCVFIICTHIARDYHFATLLLFQFYFALFIYQFISAISNQLVSNIQVFLSMVLVVHKKQNQLQCMFIMCIYIATLQIFTFYGALLYCQYISCINNELDSKSILLFFGMILTVEMILSMFFVIEQIVNNVAIYKSLLYLTLLAYPHPNLSETNEYTSQLIYVYLTIMIQPYSQTDIKMLKKLLQSCFYIPVNIADGMAMN